MVRASEKVRAKKIMSRACVSLQKAWLDRAELLKTRGSRAQIRAEPRLDPALLVRYETIPSVLQVKRYVITRPLCIDEKTFITLH